MTPKEEFIELVAQNNRARGIDDTSSKIIGILYAEPRPVSLEELSRMTGYSLSGISTAMKFLENGNMIQRIKKPGSRKAYFFMEKDLLGNFVSTYKKILNNLIIPSKKQLPDIIQEYRKLKIDGDRKENSKKELEIVKNYYNQLIIYDKLMKEHILMLETLIAKERKEGKRKT